jgi:hypothetical protein
MPIKFACQNCDKSLSVSSSKIGRRANCPRCGEPITVPDREAAAESLASRAVRREKSGEVVDNPEDEDEGDPFAAFVVYDDTELVYDEDRAYYVEESSVDRDKVAVPRAVLYTQGILLVIVAVVFLVIGIAIGRGTTSGDPMAAVPRKCIVSGLVTYKGSPDTGSVVILLPTEGKFDAPPNLSELRPESPRPGSTNTSLLAIREAGGAYDRVDEEGNFAVNVQNSREYYVLYISRAGKVGNVDLTKIQRAQIGQYFFPPEVLVGQNHFRWITADIRGERLELDEVIFE